jgi:Leucine-rich repeat (LRR) protein
MISKIDAINERNQFLSQISTEHIDGLNNDHVKCFRINEFADVKFVPHGIVEIFPNLVEFYLMTSGAKEIFRSDFKELVNLRSLSFYNDWIEHLDEDTFDDLTKLELLSLSRNQIEVLPEKIFHNLGELRRVYLGENRIKKLTKEIFAKNLKIEIIAIGRNNLVHIDPFNPSNFKQLVKLNLQNNDCIDFELPKITLHEINKWIKKLCDENHDGNVLDTCRNECFDANQQIERFAKENIELRNRPKRYLIL